MWRIWRSCSTPTPITQEAPGLNGGDIWAGARGDEAGEGREAEAREARVSRAPGAQAAS